MKFDPPSTRFFFLKFETSKHFVKTRKKKERKKETHDNIVLCLTCARSRDLTVAHSHSHRTNMDYGAAASHAAAAGPPPAADPHHPHYPHPYAGYPTPTRRTTRPPRLGARHRRLILLLLPHRGLRRRLCRPVRPLRGVPVLRWPCRGRARQRRRRGLPGYYFGAGEAFQAPASSASQGAPAATAAAGKEAGKHFGFDPQRYAQVRIHPASLLIQCPLVPDCFVVNSGVLGFERSFLGIN